MDPKFIREGNSVYMRVVEIKNGLADLSRLEGLNLSVEDWQCIAKCALQLNTGQNRLLNTEQLASAIDCSRAMVARYVGQGMPHINLADSKSHRRLLRFEIDKCKDWLEKKSEAKTSVDDDGAVNMGSEMPLRSCTNCMKAKNCGDYDFDNTQAEAERCEFFAEIQKGEQK